MLLNEVHCALLLNCLIWRHEWLWMICTSTLCVSVFCEIFCKLFWFKQDFKVKCQWYPHHAEHAPPLGYLSQGGCVYACVRVFGFGRFVGRIIQKHCRDGYWSQLWLRSRAATLLSEGCEFDSPGLHVKVSLGNILTPKLLLMCWSAPCMAATTISVCMNYCKLLWTKASAKSIGPE